MTYVVYLYDKCQGMQKKNLKTRAEYKTQSKVSKIHEPLVSFSPAKQIALVKDFNYKEFKKIADKVPFTLQEWSQILHISERTLQRYAKANSNFPFSVVDRILQIDKVVKRGVEVFGSLDKFIRWLRINPPALDGRISVHSLATFEGINLVLAQITRIEHGVLA